MSRRTRRAQRQLRRGHARREPLLLVADDRADLIEWIEWATRIGFRYRSELVPFILAGTLWLTAAILNGNQLPPWWVLLAAAPVAGGLCWPRVAPLLRPIERGYAVAITVLSGGWLTAATALGPNTPPLPLGMLVGTIAGGVPWWAHRRRRAKVRVERTLDAWPDITAAVGIPGSRIMSAVVDRWGWRARIGLPPGTTATDLINTTPALESGLRTRPGAVRVEPDPDRADHATIRVLTTDPHDHPIPYPNDTDSERRRSVTNPIPLGLFEDAKPVLLRLTHRHGLLGGVAGAGKSGVLNVILAELVACPDVVLWGIDLKGGMELQPWAACLGRLATTPTDAAGLLSDAVAVLDTRARQMAADGSRLWAPTPHAPALIVVIDEYAELADEAPVAISISDSIARRGRAVAVTLLAATQRPTQKAMGSGAVRSQMDVRICLRVRERRDVDLILGQGMLAAGWAADALNTPGKFLISTPEHTTPRRARAYRVDDQAVAAIAARHAAQRPALDGTSRRATDETREAEQHDPGQTPGLTDPADALWAAIVAAPPQGCSVKDLMMASGMGRSWVYSRLQAHATAGRVTQISRGRWALANGADRQEPR
jgi:S-DNA-T family DNA segregation ATPase FtsK/SpoIIIE